MTRRHILPQFLIYTWAQQQKNQKSLYQKSGLTFRRDAIPTGSVSRFAVHIIVAACCKVFAVVEVAVDVVVFLHGKMKQIILIHQIPEET